MRRHPVSESARSHQAQPAACRLTSTQRATNTTHRARNVRPCGHATPRHATPRRRPSGRRRWSSRSIGFSSRCRASGSAGAASAYTVCNRRSPLRINRHSAAPAQTSHLAERTRRAARARARQARCSQRCGRTYSTQRAHGIIPPSAWLMPSRVPVWPFADAAAPRLGPQRQRPAERTYAQRAGRCPPASMSGAHRRAVGDRR
jgi:hypothetical protein